MTVGSSLTQIVPERQVKNANRAKRWIWVVYKYVFLSIKVLFYLLILVSIEQLIFLLTIDKSLTLIIYKTIYHICFTYLSASQYGSVKEAWWEKKHSALLHSGIWGSCSCMCAKSLQFYPTHCDLCLWIVASHRILQTRILESVVMPSSRGSSWPRDWTYIFYGLLNWQDLHGKERAHSGSLWLSWFWNSFRVLPGKARNYCKEKTVLLTLSKSKLYSTTVNLGWCWR